MSRGHVHGEAEWKEDVADFRRRKDQFFKEDHRSPVPHDERRSFRGLSYYPASAEWIVAARVGRIENGEKVKLGAVHGEADAGVYTRYAKATFETPNGEEATVTLYAPEHDHHGHAPAAQGSAQRALGTQSVPHHEPHELFLPFRDATSGKTTYGAGRYLEVENPLGSGDDLGEMEIDLNLAYNPSCAYDDAYVCPMPPAENWLKVAVEAGEKVYREA